MSVYGECAQVQIRTKNGGQLFGLMEHVETFPVLYTVKEKIYAISIGLLILFRNCENLKCIHILTICDKLLKSTGLARYIVILSSAGNDLLRFVFLKQLILSKYCCWPYRCDSMRQTLITPRIHYIVSVSCLANIRWIYQSNFVCICMSDNLDLAKVSTQTRAVRLSENASSLHTVYRTQRNIFSRSIMCSISLLSSINCILPRVMPTYRSVALHTIRLCIQIIGPTNDDIVIVIMFGVNSSYTIAISAVWRSRCWANTTPSGLEDIGSEVGFIIAIPLVWSTTVSEAGLGFRSHLSRLAVAGPLLLLLLVLLLALLSTHRTVLVRRTGARDTSLSLDVCDGRTGGRASVMCRYGCLLWNRTHSTPHVYGVCVRARAWVSVVGGPKRGHVYRSIRLRKLLAVSERGGWSVVSKAQSIVRPI